MNEDFHIKSGYIIYPLLILSISLRIFVSKYIIGCTLRLRGIFYDQIKCIRPIPISDGSTATQAFSHTVTLAQEVEKLGYTRFWVSEHHNSVSLAGSSPEILISHIAAKTERMRVGSGGVMLPHYSPYKVAENFRVLEALYPNRIDLGVGRAPGGMPIATRALQEGKMVSIDQYPEQIADVAMYLHDQVPENHHYANLKATPVIPTSPDMWLLGSSGESAKIAAQQGASFAFAQFINGYGGPEVMEAYQNNSNLPI